METHTRVETSPTPAIQPGVCAHCGNPLDAGTTGPFCCVGCETVHTLLETNGLDRYYALRGEHGTPVPDTHPESRDRRWMEPIVARIQGADAPVHVECDLQGMQCAACVWLIEQLFERSPHGLRIVVNPGSGRAAMDVGRGFDLESFSREIERFGYVAGPPRQAQEKRRDVLLLRLAVSIAIAMNAMIFALPIYLGLREGAVYHAFRWITFALTTVNVLVGGSVFFRSAIQAAKRRILHLDVPIALGIAFAYSGSTYAFAVGNDRGGYFDTLNVFIALMLVGRYLQQRVLERNRQALLAPDAIDTLLARRIEGDRLALVKCTELVRGDAMLIARGEVVPIEGVLDSPRASCSLDWIQGEAEPRDYVRGDVIPAGAFNSGAEAVTVRALADFADSQLLPLIRTPREQGEDLAKSTRWWQNLAAAYVVAVLVIATVTFVGWLWATKDLRHAMQITTAVLVITCPCAFGIATPVAYELTLQRLRERGLFVRSASFLDRAIAVKRVVFDKTGTLTTGIPTVVDPEALRTLDARDRDVLYNLAARSNHPRSIAVRRVLEGWARFRGDVNVSEVPACGMEALIDGRQYWFGRAPSSKQSSRLFAGGGRPAGERVDHSAVFPITGARAKRGRFQRRASELAPTGEGALVFTRDGVLLATIETEERLRPDAVREVAALKSAGLDVRILSGDAPERVRETAAKLALDAASASGGCTPDDKARWIAANDRHDTLMIGDGINDALALSTAFASGTPAVDRPFVPARADFYFTTAGLHPVALVLAAAKKLAEVHRRNLCIAVAYNALAVAAAAAGLVTPIVCAIVMPLSSLSLLLTTTASFSKGSTPWKS